MDNHQELLFSVILICKRNGKLLIIVVYLAHSESLSLV